MLVSARYVISGAIMLAFAMARGIYVPRGRELAAACFSGFFTLGVGNGALVFSELLIPSGMASLIITTQPFWMVGFEALLPGGERLHAPTIGGMAIGLVGASFLFRPDVGVDRNVLHGFLLLEVGLAGWSFGSIYQRADGEGASGDRGRGAATGGGADSGAVRTGHPRAPRAVERARRGGADLPGLFRVDCGV